MISSMTSSKAPKFDISVGKHRQRSKLEKSCLLNKGVAAKGSRDVTPSMMSSKASKIDISVKNIYRHPNFMKVIDWTRGLQQEGHATCRTEIQEGDLKITCNARWTPPHATPLFNKQLFSNLDLCRCFPTEISHFEAFDDIINDIISHDCFATPLVQWTTLDDHWTSLDVLFFQLLLFSLTRTRVWLGLGFDSANDKTHFLNTAKV